MITLRLYNVFTEKLSAKRQLFDVTNVIFFISYGQTELFVVKSKVKTGGEDLNRILNKAALLLFIISAVTVSSGLYLPVMVILFSVTLSALNQVFFRRKFSVLILLLQILLSFINPLFCCGIPLTVYDILSAKKPLLLAVLPFALLFQFSSLSRVQLLIIICGAFTAYLFERNTSRLEKAENELIEIRDNSEEVNILLRDKNRRLLENQDYEINIATMKERNRIAREIHDNVGHMLTRSILQVGALSVINKDETMKEGLSDLKDTLNNAMTSIRSSVHNLHDDSISLKLTAEEAIKPLHEVFDVSTVFDFSETMDKNIKLCFIGIIKECVSNAIKHSKGDKAEISIQEHPAFYRFSYGDNGKCDSVIKETGIGLSNIRERASIVGGIVNISADSKGFKVVVSVPKK